MERAGEIFGEGIGFGVEGDVAGEADGAGDELLAGAAWADDEGGEFAHVIEEHAQIAAKVGGEDRMPDGGAQLGGGHRAADDVAEDEMKCAADLKKAGEDVRWRVARLELLIWQIEVVIELHEEGAIEVDLLRGRSGGGGDEI